MGVFPSAFLNVCECGEGAGLPTYKAPEPLTAPASDQGHHKPPHKNPSPPAAFCQRALRAAGVTTLLVLLFRDH